MVSYPVNDLIRAYSYLRFSNAVQSGGDSGRRQADFAAKLCERNGWLLDDSLTLQDLGVSAFRSKNKKEGALGVFIDAVKSGRVLRGSVLIVENIDRLSRDLVGIAFQNFLELLNLGITIVTAEPERTYTQTSINDIAGILEPIIYMSRANEESRMKSIRVRAAWHQRKRRSDEGSSPLTAMTPFWIEVTDGAYRLIPERAATVRSIFAMTREGLGSLRVLNALRGDPERYPPWGRSGQWNRKYVESILRSRATFGEHQHYRIDPETGEKGPEGEPVRGFFPAVISEEEFYAARAATEGRKRKCGRPSEKELNLFTGMVFEASEKQPMHLRSVDCPAKGNQSGRRYVRLPKTKQGRRRYSYLVSLAFARGEKLGGGPRFGRSLPYAPFEHFVLSAMLELGPSELTQATGDANRLDEEIRALTEELVSHDQKLRTYAAKVSDKATPASALPTYLTLLEQASEDKDGVSRRLEKLKAEALSGRPETLGEVQSFVRMLDALGGEEAEAVRLRLKSRLKLLIKDIWVLVEKVGTRRRAAHIKIYLRSGAARYGVLFNPEGTAGVTLDLKHADFRDLALPGV